jgi:hypothetical protein
MRVRVGLFAVLLATVCSFARSQPPEELSPPAAQLAREEFFENEIRPLLAEHCIRCHGQEEQSGKLGLDSRAGLLKGGEHGTALVAGQPDASLLIQAVRRDGELQMPPDDALTQEEIRALEHWVATGAAWPERSERIRAAAAPSADDHWAFQPIRDLQPPSDVHSHWGCGPIDAFILSKLRERELAPSPEADRRTLIRRLSYSLTGLPPSEEDVNVFVHDADPFAYERLVDRYLASPQYGEAWARHWLDVARYSDTKGYVYAREERFWTHAWAYRDWVVRALNEDMPYNRFVLLQIAADQVEDRRPDDLAAMGFLTIGRRFLGVQRDIIDDRIDVVCRGTMGLTVGCARCHDHKYDPIPTADYYSLYGVFASCAERLVPLSETGNEAFQKELAARQEKLQRAMAAARAETAARVRERVADYLQAQLELEKYPEEGFDQILAKTDILPAFVRRWQAHLRTAARDGDPIFAAWHAYREIQGESFAEQAPAVTQRLAEETGRVHPLVAERFAAPPATFREVVKRYGELFREIDARWQAELKAAEEAGREPPTGFDDPQAEQLRRVLYGPGAPCEVPDEPIVHTENDFDSGTCTELWKLQGEVDRWIINSDFVAPFALTLVDREVPTEPRVFERGNPATKGAEVPRQFLELIEGEERRPFQHGSGRRELADAIIDPTNPLTSRVIVNRVWAHHFGEGLASTPSDFGTRAAPPSHPELLDWLAMRFVQDGWSLKRLHRRIVLSSAFRQASTGPQDEGLVARAMRVDPGNRLLWRMNARRLSFEEFRDSLLAVSGELDPALGGKPAKMFEEPYPRRRTLYGLIDRQFLPGALRMFDFANPDLHMPERSETTVPQQALFLLNHPLVLERVRALAASIPLESDPGASVNALFHRVLQREPGGAQAAAALQLLQAGERGEQPSLPPTAADWSYGYGAFDAGAERVVGFTPLPHFTGSAWQGGPNWPDATLGWVQLTAEGGHPGNDREHACVRRWTAPRKMSISIRSKLVHEAAAGDGVRAFIVSSRAGVVASAKAHQQTIDLNVAPLKVEAGETLDFLVDIGNVLNSDQHLWSVAIAEADTGKDAPLWDSRKDFTGDPLAPLTPWEQLAQALLCSNEFLFID